MHLSFSIIPSCCTWQPDSRRGFYAHSRDLRARTLAARALTSPPSLAGTPCAASRRDALLGSAALLATAAAPPAATAVGGTPIPETASAARTSLKIMSSGQLDAAKTVARKLVTKTKAPLLLRLLFHDAFTYRAASGDGGPNASIQFELDRPENAGLKRGWSTIREVRALRRNCAWRVHSGTVSDESPLLGRYHRTTPSLLCHITKYTLRRLRLREAHATATSRLEHASQSTCSSACRSKQFRRELQAKSMLVGTDGGDMSEADLIVVLAAAAVYVCGGPVMTVFVGRDAAERPDPEGRMPREDFTAPQLQDFFAAANFNTQVRRCSRRRRRVAGWLACAALRCCHDVHARVFAGLIDLIELRSLANCSVRVDALVYKFVMVCNL